MPFIDLMVQQERIRHEVDAAVSRVLDHGQYIMGPEVLELEKKLGELAGGVEVISCSSGTDAIWLPLLAYGIGAGDAVFLPSFTFTATAEAVCLTGATPVFVDIDPQTFNIDPASLCIALADVRAETDLRPRAVMPVDLFGLPAPYTTIEPIARENGLAIISDAAQSLGGRSGDVPVGKLADVTGTSFFPAKPLGCYGDGGAIFSGSSDLAETLRSIRVHGRGASGKYDNVRVGTNARLDTIQASVLLEKLKIFDEEIALRQHVAGRYEAGLWDVVTTPSVPQGSVSAWAQYTIVCEHRDDLAAALDNVGVPTQIYYPCPLHQQLPYLNAPKPKAGLPVTEDLTSRVLSLPFYPYLPSHQQDQVIESIRQFYIRRETKTTLGAAT
ncbi:DegT/DnrJ/EryC1/StrS aminotransferase family protein [Ferruginivarius sediminum]|uniref:DegT/DnrJ/EryC1/StrS aminotransferase family protein n=1 Tax=Ferruginivarius sediminum TaxID=2661937 RepID=A0A369T7J2_9PROT|nr:DegT/DnrJ/EryC1/StrS aminotransferase family protein [Ferruginivarius sediminum]